ncbi:MAG: MATE family efflux transporter, partial [Anaerotignum sp.]|nr:MATE family efflux transporter [Anaerotignum sp.]
MEKNKNIKMLSEGPVSKALLKLGIPTMVGMMVSSLYNLVDAYFVGTLGTSQQAAVAAVFPVGLVLLGIGLLFGSGAGSYLSRLLGNGEKDKADECASTALAISVVTALALVGIMLAAINPLLRLLGCTDTMLPYAKEYAIPFILGLVVNVFNVTMSNLATAEGAPMYSMRSMLLGGVVNIILDPLLITTFHMGVFGAAIATLISRLISLASYLLYLFQKKSSIHFSVKNIRMEKKLFLEIAKIGVPTCIYQILCSVALSTMNNLATPYGDAAIAAVGIVSRITTLGIMTIMGFLKGYQTFVGFNYGAKNYARLRRATQTAVLWTTIFCILCCGGMLLFRDPLIQAFNK